MVEETLSGGVSDAECVAPTVMVFVGGGDDGVGAVTWDCPYESQRVLCFGSGCSFCYSLEFGNGGFPVVVVFAGDVEGVGVGDSGRLGDGVVEGPEAGDGFLDLASGDTGGHPSILLRTGLVSGFCHHLRRGLAVLARW